MQNDAAMSQQLYEYASFTSDRRTLLFRNASSTSSFFGYSPNDEGERVELMGADPNKPNLKKSDPPILFKVFCLSNLYNENLENYSNEMTPGCLPSTSLQNDPQV